jgi:hypothetical protein
MKKITLFAGFLSAVLMLSAVWFMSVPQGASASNGAGLYYYQSPDSSYYSRSSNPYYLQYRWGNQSFNSFDDLVAYLRVWFDQQQQGNTHEENNSTYYRSYDRSYNTNRSYNTSSSYLNITTNDAIDVARDTATLEGTIDFNGSSRATVWFNYGPGSDLKWNTTKVRVTDGNGPEEFGRILVGLERGQRYSFRAVGQDENGHIEYGSIRTFTTDDGNTYRNTYSDTHYYSNNYDEPSVETLSVQSIDRYSATLRGSVDMNDFRDGRVFFVYGEDRSEVEDVADRYNSYNDIDEDGYDLQKVSVDSNVDGSQTYSQYISGLASNTTIYAAMGVEYEDRYGNSVLRLGNMWSFTTDY